jgi:hypothetical protein
MENEKRGCAEVALHAAQNLSAHNFLPQAPSATNSTSSNLSHNISQYLGSGQRPPTGQEISFDFCFNYFQSFRRKGNIEALAASENIEIGCLQLGFFLASWNMFRNSPLQRRSSKHYERLIKNVAQFDPTIWEIDVPDYRDAAKVSLLLDCGDKIAASLEHFTPLLKTKVMLAIFGNVPAFDSNFCLPEVGLRKNATFCAESLKKILEFYNAHKNEIDTCKIPTLDFLTGQPTNIQYSRARIIDIFGYVEGGGDIST